MIILDTPRQLYAEATKVDISIGSIWTNEITVRVLWYAADDSIVKTETLRLSGTNLANIADAQIDAGDVGKKLLNLLVRTIRKEVREMLMLQGTVR